MRPAPVSAVAVMELEPVLPERHAVPMRPAVQAERAEQAQ
jgi:hypothetical protein